jgi:Fe-S cluster biogenesis protein NfuA
VTIDGEFQEKVQQLGKLVAQFDQLPDSAAKVAGRELVQLLMDVHGRGLERVMEIIFTSGDHLAPGIIDRLGRDPIVGNLLLLYSLHPDGLEARVRTAVERLRPRLRKLACSIELESISEGSVQVRLTSGHSCGSSTRDLQSIVEEAIYEAAPDLASLKIQGLEEQTPAGFVALESLLGQHLVGTASSARAQERNGAD